MQKRGPRGWTDGQVTTRFVSAAPASYDPISHRVDCIISGGAAVKRFYGTEILKIDRDAVNLGEG
jgi:hypothetical protein